MRLDAELAEPGAHRPSQVMQHPWLECGSGRDRDLGIERQLERAPPRVGCVDALTEEMHTVLPRRPQDLERRSRQRQRQGMVVLGARARDGQYAVLVKLVAP